MYFTEKKIEYADLVIPFTKCPFKKIEHDCPFVECWKQASIEKQVQLIEDLPVEELDLLRKHHRICVRKKSTQRTLRLKAIIGIYSNKGLVFNIEE